MLTRVRSIRMLRVHLWFLPPLGDGDIHGFWLHSHSFCCFVFFSKKKRCASLAFSICQVWRLTMCVPAVRRSLPRTLEMVHGCFVAGRVTPISCFTLFHIGFYILSGVSQGNLGRDVSTLLVRVWTPQFVSWPMLDPELDLG